MECSIFTPGVKTTKINKHPELNLDPIVFMIRGWTQVTPWWFRLEGLNVGAAIMILDASTYLERAPPPNHNASNTILLKWNFGKRGYLLKFHLWDSFVLSFGETMIVPSKRNKSNYTYRLRRPRPREKQNTPFAQVGSSILVGRLAACRMKFPARASGSRRSQSRKVRFQQKRDQAEAECRRRRLGCKHCQV